jgi:outer membrane biosynthesis protein TonB
MPFKNDEYANLPSGTELLNKLARDAYTPDFIEKKGPFLAKVLRVEQITNDSDDLTWVEEINNNFKNEEEGKGPSPFDSMLRLKVVARIDNKILEGQPNIHAHIPEPTQLGNETEVDAYNNQLIDEHDEFISMSEGVAALIPTPGDYVWVDYLDKQNFSRPIYIGPLKGNIGVGAAVPCPPPLGAAAAFNQKQRTGQPAAAGTGQPQGAGTGQPAVNNPALLKGAAVGGVGATGRQYKLHGYVVSDFTKQKIFKTDEYLRASMERMVAGVEVFHWYIEQLYPGKKVKVVDPVAGTKAGHAKFSAHKNGSALDFDATVDGKTMDRTELSVIIYKLIVSGKIPDGGVGVYQTAWERGPNRGKTDTFTNRNSLPLSDVPHWDYGIEKNKSPYWDENKTVNKKGYQVRKWIDHTKGGKKKSLSKVPNTVQQWLENNNNRLPKYLLQKYNELQAPAPDMPTWEQVIALRASLASGNKAFNDVEIKNPTPTNENTPKQPTPEEKKKQEEAKKKEEKEAEEAKKAEKEATGKEVKSEEEKKKDEAKKAADKKSGAAEKKQATDAKKAATATETKSIPQTPPASGSAAAAGAVFNPCIRNAALLGGALGGAAAAAAAAAANLKPSATGVVNTGTTINLPPAKKPKGLFSNPEVTTDVYTNDPKAKGSLKFVQIFVIHESGGYGSAHQVASERAKKIKKGTDQVFNKYLNKYEFYDQKYQVHFWGGRAGDIALTTELNSPCAHAQTHGNRFGIGYEVVNLGPRTKKKSRAWLFENNVEGYRVLGPDGNVGGPLTNKMLDGSVVKGTGVLKEGLGWLAGTRNYVLPGEIQCRRVWETIVWCSDKNPNRLHKDVVKIPILFPATANDKKLSTGFKSSLGGGASIFVWGQFNPMVDGFKGGNVTNGWYKDLGPRRKKPKHHWQQGIVAHNRWPSHWDGCFIEYYCLGRALGMSSVDAYMAAIGAAAASNPKNNKKLNVKQDITYFPDQKYVNYGKKIWGGPVTTASLNWAQVKTSLIDPAGKLTNPKIKFPKDPKLGKRGEFTKVIG